MADDIIKQFPDLYGDLIKSSPHKRDDLPTAWKNKTGIYVFYEDDTPIYVGRWRNLKDRIMQHSRPSVRDSPLALKLTAEALNHRTSYRKGEGRTALRKIPQFTTTFIEMKDRVREMKVRAIVLNDDPKGLLSHLFEAYVAAKLDTPYNSFLTS